MHSVPEYNLRDLGPWDIEGMDLWSTNDPLNPMLFLDACHAYALRCAAKNSLNWRLTAERSLYIHGATSLCFRTRQLNTDDSLDPDRPTDNI